MALDELSRDEKKILKGDPDTGKAEQAIGGPHHPLQSSNEGMPPSFW